jgi:hypothetical protein
MALDVKQTHTGRCPLPFFKVATKDGATLIPGTTTVGTGGHWNAVLNYTAAGVGETDYEVGPPAGQIWHIQDLFIHIRDVGAFAATGYGAGAGLTFGVQAVIHSASAGTIYDCLAGIRVFNNSDWSKYENKFLFASFGGGLTIKIPIGLADEGIRVAGDLSDHLSVILNDDHTTLTHHTFMIKGFIER